MGSAEHLEILRRGAHIWNAWYQGQRAKTPSFRGDLAGFELYDIRKDLRGVDLSDSFLNGANLSGMRLMDANLRGADLTGALLQRTDLTDSKMRGAILCRASLFNADLSYSDLTDADLTGADLQWSNLSYAIFRRSKLSGARLSGASAQRTIFADIDFHECEGLNSLVQLGASTLGTDTVVRSRGALEEDFLYSAGVPLEHINTLTPSQYKACFISYAGMDETFADKLWVSLKSCGVPCWYAPNDAQAGKKLREQIHDAIDRYPKFILILSRSSMTSDWVKREVTRVRERELSDGVTRVIPIRIDPFELIREWEWFDDDTGRDPAQEIREFFIPDFSSWKDDRFYAEALKKLLDALTS